MKKRGVAWDDPRVLRIGKQKAADAYDLADYLNWRGADATALLMTDEQYAERAERRAERLDGGEVHLPIRFADVVMAVLLSLPRKGNKRGRRPVWSIDEAQALINRGMSKRKAAQMLSEQTGLDAEGIRARLREKKAGKKTPGLITVKKSRD